MSQPELWERVTSLTQYALDNPSATYPPAVIDGELNNGVESTNQIIGNLGLIQRDDGALRNGIVQPDSLSASVIAMLGTLNPRGLWATLTAYAIGDLVEKDGIGYVAAIAHTSGTFSTDHTAGKWVALSPIISTFAATVLDDTSAGGMLTTLGFSAFTQTLIDDVDAATFLATLGLAVSSYAKTFLDDPDAATARTTLGVPGTSEALLLATGGTVAAAVTVQGLLSVDANIKFPSTQVPAADANTLDDYEEGSWTPALSFGGSAVGLTYGSRSGIYTKIGDLVFACYSISLSAKGSSTGAAIVSGLPATISLANGGNSSYPVQFLSLAGNHVAVFAVPIGNSTAFAVTGNTAAATANNNALDEADFANGTSIQGMIIYKAA